MSDVVYQALIAALLAVYMEWSRRQAASKVAEVAVKQELAFKKVADVKATLEGVTKAQDHLIETVLEKVTEVAKTMNGGPPRK